MTGKRVNKFKKINHHLKSKQIDEKIELLSEVPTNNTGAVYVIEPEYYVQDPDYLDDNGDVSYTQDDPELNGRDTTGLFAEDGTILTEEPPGDTSYVLGPMSSMYYTYTSPAFTTIGYIRQSDRKMINLGRIDGQLDRWDGESNFTSYGQLTLEQAIWFRDIEKIDDYRAFYPGPPSGGPDEYGRYRCKITGKPKPRPRTPPRRRVPPVGGGPEDAGFPWGFPWGNPFDGIFGKGKKKNFNTGEDGQGKGEDPLYKALPDNVKELMSRLGYGINAEKFTNDLNKLNGALVLFLKGIGNLPGSPSPIRTLAQYADNIRKTGSGGVINNPLNDSAVREIIRGIEPSPHPEIFKTDIKTMVKLSAQKYLSDFHLTFGSGGYDVKLTDQGITITDPSYKFAKGGANKIGDLDLPAMFDYAAGALSLATIPLGLALFGFNPPTSPAKLEQKIPMSLIKEVNPELYKQLKDGMNENVSYKSGNLLTESKKKILREVKKPYILPEAKKEKIKHRPKVIGSAPRVVGGDMMKKAECPTSFKPIEEKMWGKYEKNKNARASQERKNQVLDLVGTSDHAWEWITETKRNKLNNIMYTNFNGKDKKYKVVRKEELKGDTLLFIVDENGKKENILQSELNDRIANEFDREIFSDYFAEQETAQVDTDPLFGRVKNRLKQVIDYPDKPSKAGYPDQPPPEMVNGWHPEYGKDKGYYDKLDPHSAAAMPSTGNPEIDSKVQKAKRLKEIIKKKA